MRNCIKSLLLVAAMACSTIVAYASYGSNPLYRYVKMDGAYTNDGLSWATAKSNIQDAINELHDYMNLQGITEGGYVFVKYGTYKPTESTSQDSQQPQYLSFKIYAGINIWGGWDGTEEIPDGSTDAELFDLEPKVIIAGPSGNFVLNQFETILDGNLSDDPQSQAKFVWSEERQRYVTTFPSNVYHVVTFATNGFTNGRANALTAPASLNVVTIRGGRAFDSDANADHPYNAYGGGVYMVGNSRMFDSRVSECEATRDGGGIYLDGGGTVSHNIITDCQALGMGIQYGRGGGVCIDQAGLVEQSYVLNNVAREGAGIGIYYSDDVKNKYSHKLTIHPYSAICKSSLISNNTATTEAGGVYMDGGGVLDGVTVARNRCNGIGAFINGMLTGQSAGVFMVGKSRAYNSVFWGGTIGTVSDSYDDVQFGAYNNGQAANKSYLGYVALSNNDLANWSYSSSNSIMSLSTNNTSPNASLNYLNYPVFQQPSPTAGVLPNLKATMVLQGYIGYCVQVDLATWKGKNPSATNEEIQTKTAELTAHYASTITSVTEEQKNTVIGVMLQQFGITSTAGAISDEQKIEFMSNLSDGMFYVASYSFKPQSVSSLAGAGVQLSDLPEEAGVDLDAAELTADVLDIAYSPLCDLGCYNTHAQATSHATGINYLETNNDGANTMTVFVDPERSSAAGNSNIGASWTTPFKHIRDALHYVWQYKQDADAEYEEHKNDSPAHEYEKPRFSHYQILVKEGTIHTAATATNERIGVSSIYMIDGVSVYGGYPAELTGTNTQQEVNGVILKRNPITYPSVVTGVYSDAGYEYNVGHLVNFCSVNNAIFDGFQLRYGNATGTVGREQGAIVAFDGGGGFVITNAFHYNGVGLAQNAATSINAMSGNKVRNCIVTGCTARMGAAVFTYAPLSTLAAEFDNCIFHNNSVIYDTDQTVADVVAAGKEHSIVRVVKGANLTFKHCDFIRNVGVGIDAQAGATLVLNNNVFYANLDRPVQNTNGFNEIQPGQTGFAKMCAPIVNGGATISGHHNRFDYLFGQAETPAEEANRDKYRFSGDLMINLAMIGSGSSNNISNLTYNSSNNPNFTYPLFKNATRNAGLSVEGDITFFGGVTDWMPNAMSPLVNVGLAGVSNTDISVVNDRSFGGSPDVGAVENSVDQPHNPSSKITEGPVGNPTATYTNLATYYVRDYGSDHTKGGDGSSWSSAINGNANYDLISGNLAANAAGSAIVEEMVDSNDPDPLNQYTSVSTYRLYNRDSHMYMSGGGLGTSDMGQAMQFVFVKTDDYVTYWNAIEVPVYKFYYFLTQRVADKVYSKTENSVTTYYYWDGSKMYNMDSKTEVGTSTVGYDPVYETIEINSAYYTLYQKTIAGDVVYYYLKDGHYWKVEDNSDCGTDGSGYEQVWQEVNVTYTRQPVGYLRFVRNGDTYDIGNTSDVNDASEFVLSGTPDSLYVSPRNALSLGTVGLTMSNAGGFWHASVGPQINPADYNPMPNATWAISVIGSANKYSFLGYRLRSKNAVNTVPAGTYVSVNTTNVAITNNITAVSLTGTTVEAEREVVKFEGHINHNDGKLTAKLTTNNNKGFGYASTKIKKVDTYYFNLLPQSSDWIVSLDPGEKAYRVRTSDNKAFSTWAKTADRDPVTYLSLATTGEEILWTLEPVYERVSSSNTVNGLQYAIMCANKAAIADNKTHEIWVAEGTYSKNPDTLATNIDGVALKFYTTYQLLEGASLYGGFPKVGNPTMKERNPKQYETFLQTILGHDAKDKAHYGDYANQATVGRVLYQANNYTKETHVDGFTIRYGYLYHAFRSPIESNLQNIINDGVNHTKIKPNISVGMSGGAGALIRAGLILENCKVTQNMCYYDNSVGGKHKDYQPIVSNDGNSTNDYHIAGGGVSSLGAVIRNCEIVSNRISEYRGSGTTVCTYGAGLFMSDGEVYNTVISGNEIEGTSTMDLRTSSDIRAGAGVYLYGGKFYNNTVVDNKITYGANISARLDVCVYIPGVFIHSNVEMYNTIISNNKLYVNNNENVEFRNYSVGSKLIYGYPVACLGANWALQPDNIKSYNSCVYTSQQYAYRNNGKNYNNREKGDAYGEQVAYNQVNSRKVGGNFLCQKNIFDNPNLDANYHEQVGSPTINKGMENIPSITIPEYDAAYEKRIQDCQIDMGAYEHNSASNVTPTVNGTSATFFVNASGVGSATAHDADNAACIEKLQKVLDAAGRYKYSNPTHNVEVRLAGYNNPTTAEYYHPLRTSDPSQADNVRSWSLMVPRGVTLKGGFADDFSGSQDILGKKTILDGGYKTTSGEQTKAYHVVTFTDRIYDPDGHPYLATDASRVSTGASSSFAADLTNQVVDENTLLHMSSGTAVLNGLFIQNGNADGIASNTSATKTYTGYGGAAVVPGFASIRNCIVQNNNALYGGGGLYLQQGATVCGTLIKSNTAKLGGGVYFEELDRTPRWTNFSTENELALVSSTVMQFAQLVNSTVTANTATSKGGGIYFDNNAHVMSSVIWGNTCGDQANVAGHTNAYTFASANEITFAKYPFCYSAVENNRLPGANNISVATDNDLGVRFRDIDFIGAPNDDDKKFATASNKIDPYYRISDFSQLAKVGSSTQSFDLSVQVFGATTTDIFGVNRKSDGFDYVDIGACAIQQVPKSGANIETILQRLYVAQPKDVDKDAQQYMLTNGGEIYSQKGSSFAYPFQTLDEALEYIRNLRKDVTTEVLDYTDPDHPASTGKKVADYARNIPFEIIMSKGFYYPTRDIYNVQGESLGNTFLVPEGVSIVGGFDVNELKRSDHGKVFYGQRYKLRAPNNTQGGNGANTYEEIPTEADDNISELMYANLVELPINSTNYTDAHSQTYQCRDSIDFGGYRIVQFTLDAMKAPRAHNDNNVNNIIEPWEFTNQTVLSGKVINSDEAANAYHVITIIADEKLVGKLPVGYKYSFGQGNETADDAAYASAAAGMKAREKGAPIDLNGLQIADGQAYRYSSIAANGYVWMDYYHGGGVMVDGNWIRIQDKNPDGTLKYDNEGNAVYASKYQNQNKSNSVAYHNIPVIMDRCHFTNNKGGYGGAVSANTDIYFSNTTFTSNQAIAYKDAQVVWSVDGEAIALNQSNASRGQTIDGEQKLPFTNIYYPGNGGAVYSTKQLTAANCMFENNEATNQYDTDPVEFKSPRSTGASTPTYQFGGAAGAVYSGSYAIVQFFNCNFVRNKANMYPCIFARYPNHYKLGHTNSPVGEEPTVAYNKVFGSVFWGNEGTNPDYKFSRNLVMATAPVMTNATIATAVPSTAAAAKDLLPEIRSHKTLVADIQNYYDQNYAQSLWFCAFEEHTHMTPHRDYDVRLAPFSFKKFVERSIMEYVYATYVKKLDIINDAYTTNAGDATFIYKDDSDYATWVATYKNRLQDYNQIIDSDNSHINGPNFTKPSTMAGLAGYMQDADWMPKRINRLTDNGWGYIVQKTKSTDIDGVIYDEPTPGNYNGDGAFFTVLNESEKFKKYVAMGDGTYMIFDAKNVSDQSTSKTIINRISKMPTPTVPTFDNQESYAYIDIGVFEFQHQRLGRPLGDVDYIWVAPAEKPENGGAIGTSWLRPTSDIQRAIETLLSNRNGHKKYLYIVQGDYKPFYTLTPAAGASRDYNAGFTINTENLNSVALSPERCDVFNGQARDYSDLSNMYVPSLTIVGGFSEEVQTAMQEKWMNTSKNELGWMQEGEMDEDAKYELLDYYAPENYRDPEAFPTTFYSDNEDSHTLIDIVDARQWYGRADNANYAPRLMDNTVIPITIDGVNFNNSAVTANVNRIGGNDVNVGAAINYALIEKFNNPKFNLEFPSTATSGRRSGGAYSTTTAPVETGSQTGEFVLNMTNSTTLTITLDQLIQQNEKLTVTISQASASDGTYGINISDGTNSVKKLIPSGKAANEDVVFTLDQNEFKDKYILYLTCIADKPVTLKNVSLYGAKLEANPIPYPELNTGLKDRFNTADGSPKLTISRCKFFGNGATGNDAQGNPIDIPTINIAQKGGKTLIYNSLFYGNNGTAIVGDNMTLVNNTIANNKRGVKLTSDGGNSQMHGNVLWMNTTEEYNLPSAMTAVDATSFTHNAIRSVSAITAGMYNTNLGDTNDDIASGPNFVDPTHGDYHLKPSLKLLNGLKHEENSSKRDDRAIYYNMVTGGDYSSLTDQQKSDYWSGAKELANKARVVGDYLDLGAYEYQNQLKPYAFYNPNVTKSGDGTTWERAYGFGNLQNAIDLVAVAVDNDKQNYPYGYVFAKGGREGKSTGEDIIMRDGVQVYGSIATSYLREPKKTYANQDDHEGTVTIANVSEYSIDLRTQRPGVAGPTTDRTIVNKVSSTTGITTANTVFDGFEVRENLDMHPKETYKSGVYDGNMLVSNTIVNSNPKNGVVNKSTVSNTLVYNTLFRGPYSQLELQGAHAYAVNVTSQNALLVANDPNAERDEDKNATRANQVVYCRENVTPTSILVDESGVPMDLNLEYQLTENDAANRDQEAMVGSAYTNEYIADVRHTAPLDVINRLYAVQYDVPEVGTVTNYPITFSDRDLLGNPRRIGTKVDNGAFESWYISGNVTAEYYELEQNGQTPKLVDLSRRNFTGNENIIAKVRYYPHEGSFVYMAPNSNLILAPSLQKLNDVYVQSSTAIAHYGHDEYAVVPSYVMMREGASIYGQGQSFLTNKITVEKSVNKYGEVIALPFPMKYMKTANDIEGTSETNTPKVYAYSGERRSLRDNDYYDGWKESEIVDNNYVVPAYEGVRFEPHSRPQDGALDAGDDFVKICFTATGTSAVDYVYSEGGPTKTVKLAKHDEYGTTTAEDMGWNCFGSPYLVANFQTDVLANNTYSMNLPHYLYEYHYQMEGDNVTGSGAYLKVPSWEMYDTNDDDTPDTHPTIILGEGVFTQTATFNDYENLVFKAPTYVAPSPAQAPEARIILFHTMSGNEEEDNEEEMEKDLSEGYEIGIYVKRSELHVEGLKGGEHIVVCSSDARIEVDHTVEHDATEFVTFITPGAHVVRVDGQSVVVMNNAK